MRPAWLVAAAAVCAGCGGGSAESPDIPPQRGPAVPSAAVGAESAGSDPVPASFRGSQLTAPTSRPRPLPPSMKAPPSTPTPATPM
ncbi:MAG: hypothetical protein IT374_13910 [Polyangiaceae bacterium]|nr:hypothetical protein [Polyangiaceae bacterium]